MTAPTILSTPVEMIRPTGEQQVRLTPDVSQEHHYVQDTSPAEAFFVRDAVEAVGGEIAEHYPEGTLDDVRAKVRGAARYSVTLSMRSTIVQGIMHPEFAGYELYASPMAGADNEQQATAEAGTGADEPDALYVPDFDADDAEELDSRTAHLVENAMRLQVNDLNSQARNERAEAAIQAARAAESADTVLAEITADEKARQACRNAAFDELHASYQPIFLTRTEAAFVAEATRRYNPEAYRAELASTLLSVEKPADLVDPPRLATVAVQEVTGHESLRGRAAVWVAGLVARLT